MQYNNKHQSKKTRKVCEKIGNSVFKNSDLNFENNQTLPNLQTLKKGFIDAKQIALASKIWVSKCDTIEISRFHYQGRMLPRDILFYKKWQLVEISGCFGSMKTLHVASEKHGRNHT